MQQFVMDLYKFFVFAFMTENRRKIQFSVGVLQFSAYWAQNMWSVDSTYAAFAGISRFLYFAFEILFTITNFCMLANRFSTNRKWNETFTRYAYRGNQTYNG